MGSSLLIGWYDPGSKRFCYCDEKKVFGKVSFIHPVYAVDETPTRADLLTENKQLRDLLVGIQVDLDSLANKESGRWDMWASRKIEEIRELVQG